MSVKKHAGNTAIEEETRRAWIKNWQPVSTKRLLEIFTYPRVQKIRALLLRHMPKGSRVVEAGCGLGPWLIELRRIGFNITGVDYQEECLQKIKDYDRIQKICAGDVRSLPFFENSFDVYLSFGVVEHFIEGPQKALQEAFRILSADGVLILSVPYKNIFLRLKAPILTLKRNRLLRKIFRKPDKVYYYQRYFKVEELQHYIRNAGFRISSTLAIDHIFSLVEFLGIFRNPKTLDGENMAAVKLAAILEKICPWFSAGSIMIIAHKNNS